MRNITTVVFDLGRVLVRLGAEGPHFGELMRGFGIEPARAFERYWFRDEVNKHMTGELSPREFHQKALEELRTPEPMTYERFAECWCDIFEPMPGMEELFKEVAARHNVGILSDCDPLHWAKVRSLLPWLETVEKPTLSFEVGYLKPHPEMYRAAAENGNCQKQECLFIDDVTGNVDGARFCGMQAIRFAGADKLRRDLRRLGII